MNSLQVSKERSQTTTDLKCRYNQHFPSNNNNNITSQNRRITECSGLEGTSEGHLVQPSCRSRVAYSRLHRTSSRLVLNISKEGDSTSSLGSLFQCSVTLRVKERNPLKLLTLQQIPVVFSSRFCSGINIPGWFWERSVTNRCLWSCQFNAASLFQGLWLF